MLWDGVTDLLVPSDEDTFIRPLLMLENEGVNQLGMVSLLALHDKMENTLHAAKAAATYLFIVSAVSEHCKGSIAAKVVADAYRELLTPYTRQEAIPGVRTPHRQRRRMEESDARDAGKVFVCLIFLMRLPMRMSKQRGWLSRKSCILTGWVPRVREPVKLPNDS
jgi:hypothetical protein